MIQNRTIICVASRWDLDPTSKHQIMKRLARHNRILWVNYHGTRRPALTWADLRAAASATARALRGARRSGTSLVQFTPFLIPGPRDNWLGRVSAWAVIRQIQRVLRLVQGHTPQPVQVWSFAPDVHFLSGRFNEERFVYYCVDDFSLFEGFDGQAIRDAEQRLLNKADVVITTSQALYEAKRGQHPHTHLVRHGVEVDHFARALDPHIGRPRELSELRGLIAGFFGLVHHWFDVELLVAVARRLPQAQFVLIGEVCHGARKLRALPNIHLLGRKPYQALPAYCAAFDVGILPFKCNDMSRYTNPVKLREYLAAGLPVVSTPMPEVMPFAPEVTVAADAESFATACQAAAHRSSIEERKRISRTVAGASWDNVVERVSAAVMGWPASSDAPSTDTPIMCPHSLPTFVHFEAPAAVEEVIHSVSN